MLIKEGKPVRIKEPINKSRVQNKATLTRLNVERLKGLLSYFSHLNATGEISDKSYEALVRYACAIFIQTEIVELVESTLEQKLEQFFLKRNFGLDNLLSEQEESSFNLDISRLLKSK